MRLKLIAKTEKLDSYSLRFTVDSAERRYSVTPPIGSSDRSIEFVFKKDGVFGESIPENARVDNEAWFRRLAVGTNWVMKEEP